MPSRRYPPKSRPLRPENERCGAGGESEVSVREPWLSFPVAALRAEGVGLVESLRPAPSTSEDVGLGSGPWWGDLLSGSLKMLHFLRSLSDTFDMGLGQFGACCRRRLSSARSIRHNCYSRRGTFSP